MVLRSAYAPVLPEMDAFLFASVGEEIEGIPLSVLSALAQLGLDPRNEAARLSHLTSNAAASQLGRLLARLPERSWTSFEIRRIAKRLVELLPAAPNDGKNHIDWRNGVFHENNIFRFLSLSPAQTTVSRCPCPCQQ